MEIGKHKYIILYIIFLVGLVVMFRYNTYMTYRDYDVKVVQLYQGEIDGKHSQIDFTGVFRTKDTGIIFDLPISAATYSQLQVGDYTQFNLRPFDIKQTFKENLIWYMGFAVYLSFMMAWSVGAVFIRIFKICRYKS